MRAVKEPTTKAAKKRRKVEDYQRYLGSSAWANVRAQALKRDSNRCRACGATKRLHVHHQTYARFGHEALDDVVTLCETCHAAVHQLAGPTARDGQLQRATIGFLAAAGVQLAKQKRTRRDLQKLPKAKRTAFNVK